MTLRIFSAGIPVCADCAHHIGMNSSIAVCNSLPEVTNISPVPSGRPGNRGVHDEQTCRGSRLFGTSCTPVHVSTSVGHLHVSVTFVTEFSSWAMNTL
jgi:hypothetical protein